MRSHYQRGALMKDFTARTEHQLMVLVPMNQDAAEWLADHVEDHPPKVGAQLGVPTEIMDDVLDTIMSAGLTIDFKVH